MVAEDAALAAFGVQRDNEASDPCMDVWPENWNALRLFQALRTQWRVGPGGPVGLDYAALPTVLRLIGLRRRDAREAFEGLQVMEGEALAWYAQHLR